MLGESTSSFQYKYPGSVASQSIDAKNPDGDDNYTISPAKAPTQHSCDGR